MCTRKRHHCIRSLSTCTQRFLSLVRGPSISRVRKLSPTVSVRRGSASRGPHSAIKAVARVRSCLHLLFTHINRPHYPSRSIPLTTRAIDRVISGILSRPRNGHLVLLTPVVGRHGNRRAGALRGLTDRNCVHTHVSNRIYSLSSPPGLRLRGGRAVRIIISHFGIHSSLARHLTRSFRATLRLSNNATMITSVSSPGTRRLLFSTGFTYPVYNCDVHRLRPQLFSFGGPTKTYPAYSNLNMRRCFSPSHIVRGPRLSLTNNTVHN